VALILLEKKQRYSITETVYCTVIVIVVAVAAVAVVVAGACGRVVRQKPKRCHTQKCCLHFIFSHSKAASVADS